uniref:Small ribosomal subunit protein uS15c n=1 Tax=Adiantum capillus-veneris TaxID=13818 RepID=RR15_ADICA|nr:ribosomal protein S15 [Adiantum capillus-veneris]Q85FG8.1 RecName: Full=Small ribosomal subunit protein uS15c; AltName: Full=30S ribosomal protein S15, chloroplastic [Adiantum capillus-veneris]AAP29448.1 ribosomal protein S15 [Adiantum capillus-veneris]
MKKQESIHTQLPGENVNTGFTASQIYYSTYQVSKLTSHLELHPRDYSSQIGLWKLLGRRKRLLAYLFKKNTGLYERVLTKLGIRGLKVKGR